MGNAGGWIPAALGATMLFVSEAVPGLGLSWHYPNQELEKRYRALGEDYHARSWTVRVTYAVVAWIFIGLGFVFGLHERTRFALHGLILMELIGIALAWLGRALLVLRVNRPELKADQTHTRHVDLPLETRAQLFFYALPGLACYGAGYMILALAIASANDYGLLYLTAALGPGTGMAFIHRHRLALEPDAWSHAFGAVCWVAGWVVFLYGLSGDTARDLPSVPAV